MKSGERSQRENIKRESKGKVNEKLESKVERKWSEKLEKNWSEKVEGGYRLENGERKESVEVQRECKVRSGLKSEIKQRETLTK